MVGEFHGTAVDCKSEFFTGYKGGEYAMDESTPLWRAEWGTTAGSRPIIEAELRDEAVVLVLGDPQ